MSWTRALPMIAFVVGLGCQNNTITLETDQGPDPDPDSDSGDPVATSIATTNDEGSDTTPVDPSDPQTLLLALDTPLAPGLPFQAIVTTAPSPGTVDVTIQFLSLDVGSTTAPRQPVGDLYAYAAVPVDASGTFYWDTGVILIPGAANPIAGADLVVSIQANVVPVGTPAYCGDVGGIVLSPLETSLDGTTHAMTAVSDVGNLPVDFAVACP